MLITEYEWIQNINNAQNLVKFFMPLNSKDIIKSFNPKLAQKRDCDVSNKLKMKLNVVLLWLIQLIIFSIFIWFLELQFRTIPSLLIWIMSCLYFSLYYYIFSNLEYNFIYVNPNLILSYFAYLRQISQALSLLSKSGKPSGVW